MSSYYNGLEFRTELLARWAAFFDLARWTWHANPAPVGDWLPDFFVVSPCGHSECPDEHSLLVSVLPVNEIDSVAGHPALQYRYDVVDKAGNSRAHAGAVFGANPSVSHREMSHGAGGGIESVPGWVDGATELWQRAGEIVNTSSDPIRP